MPNIKSAAKRVKIIAKKTARNNQIKSALKTELKKFDVAVSGAEADANEAYKNASKALDKAVSKGVIHKNAAARKKSRLYKKLDVNVNEAAE